MGNVLNEGERFAFELKELTKNKPKGGERFLVAAQQATETKEFRLFVPWAAPPSGRTELAQADRAAIDWLSSPNGLVGRIATYGEVSCTVMFADVYMERNKFDMNRAWRYWQQISGYLDRTLDVEYITTSSIEDNRMRQLRAQKAYALEELGEPQKEKIIRSAAKYSSLTDTSLIYESAAEYTMLRAAEAEYVALELNAFWVSLNWPDRDIMCRDVPRIYVPEELRAPWLKEN